MLADGLATNSCELIVAICFYPEWNICDDQIQSASLDVQWPEMTPSNSFKNMGKPNFVSITLNQRSVWDFEKWGEKNFFDETKILINYSKTIQYDWGSERSIDEINTIKMFNTALELYEIPGYDNEGSRMTVYWQEIEGKGISLTIPCVYYKNSGGSSCEYVTHVPDYGYNTSYLKINFHADLLPRWKELHRDALQLIDQFTVKGNKE